MEYALNIYAGWIGVVLGVVTGAVQGLRFDRDDWMGGYSSWPRRMTRLGHISFFGIAFLNFSFAFSADVLNLNEGLGASSVLLVAGAVTMPIVCYASAAYKPARHLFFAPVLLVLGGAVLFLLHMFLV